MAVGQPIGARSEVRLSPRSGAANTIPSTRRAMRNSTTGARSARRRPGSPSAAGRSPAPPTPRDPVERPRDAEVGQPGGNHAQGVGPRCTRLRATAFGWNPVLADRGLDRGTRLGSDVGTPVDDARDRLDGHPAHPGDLSDRHPVLVTPGLGSGGHGASNSARPGLFRSAWLVRYRSAVNVSGQRFASPGRLARDPRRTRASNGLAGLEQWGRDVEQVRHRCRLRDGVGPRGPRRRRRRHRPRDSVHPYSNGVIDHRLPIDDRDVVLPPEWALQDPEDYLRVFQTAIPDVLRAAGVAPADVIGVGIDFTACTMLPTTADGTPLCLLPGPRAEPHAWVKLWKHHAAQPEADRISHARARRGLAGSLWREDQLRVVLRQVAPDPRRGAARLRPRRAAPRSSGLGRLAADRSGDAQHLHRRLQGDVVEAGRFPPNDYFAALDPRFADVVDTRMSREPASMGERAGGLTEQAAAWTGLRPGTAVAVANVDAHVAVPEPR